jgi:hypothetical protein
VLVGLLQRRNFVEMVTIGGNITLGV